MEILDEQEGDEQSADNGADCLEDIDFPYRASIFLVILGIEFTAVGEEGTVADGDRKKDEEGGKKDRGKTQPFSGSSEKDILKRPAEVNGKGEGDGEKKLQKDIHFKLFFNFLYSPADEERAYRLEDEPVGQNDTKSEFIA